MRAGIGAERDAVAVDVEIAAEILAGVELFGRHHLAAVVGALVVPLEGLAQAMVHADVEIGHDEHRRLQPVGEVERVGGEVEALLGILGEQQHVLGVAVGGVGAAQQVGLLGARRHAGRRPAALHVDDHRRHLGEGGEADELGHQRDARARRAGEGARAVPAGADHDADRGELVLGLDDGVLGLAGLLVVPQPLAMAPGRPRPARRRA